MGKSALHNACERSNISLAQTLIQNYKADPNVQDHKYKYTPLHVAISKGNNKVAMALMELGCSTNIKGRSVLHIACKRSNISLIQTLICNYKADPNAQDYSMCTPLHVAALRDQNKVAVALIELGCSTNLRDQSGRSVLHIACVRSNISLVQTLVHDYKTDLNAQDNSLCTPLHVAVLEGEDEVAVALIELGCKIDVKDSLGRYIASERGNVSFVQTLTHDYKVELNAQDNSKDTPLHKALSERKEKVAMLLIEFGCRLDIRNYLGKSVLHSACESGCTKVVRLLSKSISPLVVDKYGDTPLHSCSRQGHIECVKALLLEINHPPVFVKNKAGLSAMDVAKSEVKSFLHQCTQENRDKISSTYNTLDDCARKQYSKAEPIARIFVLGNPGAGKSSLIATLKKETLGFFESFQRVTVPLHTAGIVPSTYKSSYYGRVLFYDFAGDPEYYSSHAAIFENFTSSKIGQNIFIFVADMRGSVDTINNTLGYWYSFIQHQKFDGKSSLIVVGSHLDRVSDNATIGRMSRLFQSFFDSIQQNVFQEKKFFLLDCCQPTSQHIKDVRSYLSTLIRDSPHHSLSLPASVLLGLLGRDFSMVAACSVERILSHIEITGIPLPQNTAFLLPMLQELHDIGLLFLVRDSSLASLQIVLNISQLTNEVHQLLFLDEANIKRQKFPGI